MTPSCRSIFPTRFRMPSVCGRHPAAQLRCTIAATSAILTIPRRNACSAGPAWSCNPWCPPSKGSPAASRASTGRTWRSTSTRLENPPVGGSTATTRRQLRAMHFSRLARGWLPGLLFMAVVSVHFATAWVGGPARNWHGQTSEYYPLLTDAFLAGQTSLLVQPSAKLLALPDPYDPVANAKFRLHDASLYHGKYYLYFGPTPALVLFLPYKVLTGSHLPTRIAVALLCNCGFACSCALFFLLAKREKWDCPQWFASAVVLSLGTVPGVAYLLRRPSFYEVAIGAGYCFVLSGFLLAAYSLGEDSPRTPSLIGAGLCFGLAAGCRPHLALLVILMVVLVAWRTRSHKTAVLGFVAPVVLCGVLLAAYNYARFQNPFDFGIQYTLLDNRTDLDEHFGHIPGNLPRSIYALRSEEHTSELQSL